MSGRLSLSRVSPTSTGGQGSGVFVRAFASGYVSHGHDTGVAVGVNMAVHGDMPTVALRSEPNNSQTR